MSMFDGFQKRDGIVVEFDVDKIEKAITKALNEVYGPKTKEVPSYVLGDIVARLSNFDYKDTKKIPTLDQVQSSVITSLESFGWADVAHKYKQYRDARDRARQKLYVKNKTAGVNITDDSLLLVNDSGYVTSPWNRQKILAALKKSTSLEDGEIFTVAKLVENRIIDSGISIVTTSFIREMINNTLLERGHSENIPDMSVYRVSSDFIQGLMSQKSVENSNVVHNNPEAVNQNISGLVLKEWALNNVFSKEVSSAHRSAALHIHDLDFPTRVYCTALSVVYIAKYGLVGLNNLSTESKPANSASVLTGHLNTFLASMQSNYAGALGLGYLNIFYAPYLVDKTDKEYKQVAQELIFNASQNAYSRGGQTLFIDFNIHSTIPEFLKDVPAIGPGGRYYAKSDLGIYALEEKWNTDFEGKRISRDLIFKNFQNKEDVVIHRTHIKEVFKYDTEIQQLAKTYGLRVLTYADYEHEAQKFALALINIWEKGDKNGRIFPFPKIDFHIDNKLFADKEATKVYNKAVELSAKNGSTYFVFDRDSVVLSACCRIRSALDDKEMLFFPEKLSFCGFQNITINIPQAAIRALRKSKECDKPVYDLFLNEIDTMMALAVKAHIDKKAFVSTIMKEPGQPLYQIGKISAHGTPFVDLNKATYIIGIIGVDDAVYALTQKHMHEDENSRLLGMKLLAHMYIKVQNLSQRHGLKITLEETPAESASRRLAKTDLKLFPETSSIVNYRENAEYYTNSIHFQAAADISLVSRIRQQSKFHSLIQSGAIVHAFVGEQQPSVEAIDRLVRQTFENTQCAQLTISPEFTYCKNCNGSERGLKDKCGKCGSENVDGVSRVVGYFSIVNNWNKSKKDGELLDRHEGNYRV